MLSEQESYERMVGSAMKKEREIETKERRNRDKIENEELWNQKRKYDWKC